MENLEVKRVKMAASKTFKNIKKMYPAQIRIVKNTINNQLMYMMPIRLDNGGKGSVFHFTMYVDKNFNLNIE